MSRADASAISPGDVIDDFEILEVVATGEASTTFRAQHRTLDREVSLKFLHPVVFSDERDAVEVARADASRIARLEHPGIAPVFAAGYHEGGLYVASAMPQGRSLAALGTARAITPAVLARVLADAAAALEAAHAQDVVHRDMRPECVTVDRWGHGVLRDFGVTRMTGRTGLLTSAAIIDALRYTAPEIVLGRPATAATDVYGLAAVAVWCLTGAPPYRDAPAAQYIAERVTAPAPALTLPDATPATAINVLLGAAMHPDPTERPPPAAFAADLGAAIAMLPAAVANAGSPLGAPMQTSASSPIGRDVTRVEARRPLPKAPAAATQSVPWATYAACAMVAMSIGLVGMLAGRASRQQAAPTIRVGPFTLNAGKSWVRATTAPGAPVGGVRLSGAGAQSATFEATKPGRLPGDPVASQLLPPEAGVPEAVRSASASLVTYRAPDAVVVARPTSNGTAFATCSKATPIGRCAALVLGATSSGKDVAVTPSKAASNALRATMTKIQQESGIASAEIQGDRRQQSAAAKRLATVLRDSTIGLKVDGVDPSTGTALKALRATLAEQAGALDDLSSATDRRSDVAIAAARTRIRVGYRSLVGMLADFRRAGYPVQQPSR